MDGMLWAIDPFPWLLLHFNTIDLDASHHEYDRHCNQTQNEKHYPRESTLCKGAEGILQFREIESMSCHDEDLVMSKTW